MAKTGGTRRAEVYADARWSDVRVVFQLVDTTARSDARAQASSAAYLSQLEQTHDGTESMGRRLASLERDYWALDGSFSLPKRDMAGEETGWWSGVLSDGGGAFAAPPTLTFDFAQDHSSVGFTIHFDEAAGEWPRDFDITTFDAQEARVSLDQVRGNEGPVYVSNVAAHGYRRMELTFLQTGRPFRRVRVAEVVFGVVQTFDRDNTVDLKLLYELDPRMEALPIGEMVITIDNRSRMYNMVNPNGAYRYLQQGQPLDTALGVGAARDTVELTDMGRHYFYRAKASDSGMTAQITARDRLQMLDRGTYRRGRDEQATVWTIVEDILADSGTGLAADIAPEAGNAVVGWQIPICTHREALRLVAQAAGAVCFMGRDDRLRLLRLEEGQAADVLDLDNMEDVPDIQVAERVNAVEVTWYRLGAEEGNERETVYEGTAELGGETVIWVNYSGAARDVRAAVTGGTLKAAEYFLYAAKLTLTGTGTAQVKLDGLGLERSESVCTARAVEPGEVEQAVKVEDPLVVTGEAAQALADWRLALEQRRLTYPIRERGDPARMVGDTVQVYDAYGEDRNAVVVKETFAYNGGLSADTEAWGGGL